ncbi:MAG: hypothetical protein KGL90_13980 [Burkholderiales bacterium]|nr:hypothetical protein [Burkholderiales bacterium]
MTDAGLDVKTVRDNFGHASISTTSIYVRTEDNARHDVSGNSATSLSDETGYRRVLGFELAMHSTRLSAHSSTYFSASLLMSSKPWSRRCLGMGMTPRPTKVWFWSGKEPGRKRAGSCWIFRVIACKHLIFQQ